MESLTSETGLIVAIANFTKTDRNIVSDNWLQTNARMEHPL